ncbi:MgtC/SapB family protein [Clostridium sp. AL.422]|uniref:MgtC/SapB family protein n=1 Tax=Clostridium TaxID=1485 RepID=UPI00293DAF57|nr:MULTISPECIES: MgtC/SapB family protein [unclassified Clostridium]MDV4152750.1 MgtC/SapB family protein [Clostridium sp. AL.422]
MGLSIKDIVVRIFLALIIGGLIGYEREVQNRSAGLRTHILVCLGATIISLLQIQIGNHAIAMIEANEKLINVINVDYGRLGAQVITGVGFIGAGAIIHNKGNIKGLTTAATLWIVACLGLSIGMGGYFISVFSAIIIFIIIVFLKRIENKFITKNIIASFQIKYIKEGEIEKEIEHFLERKKVKIKRIEYCYNENSKNEINSKYIVLKPKKVNFNRILEEIKEKFNIIEINNINV